MLICTICSARYPWRRPCDQSHTGLCHDCWQTNMAGNVLEGEAHPAPLKPVPHLTAHARRVLEADEA